MAAKFKSLQDTIRQYLTIVRSPFNSYGSVMQGVQSAAAGDPMWGQPVLGTNYQYNDLSQTQIMAMYWYNVNSNLPAGIEKGDPTDATLQQVLDASRGPVDPQDGPTGQATYYWNDSYTWWAQHLGIPLHP